MHIAFASWKFTFTKRNRWSWHDKRKIWFVLFALIKTFSSINWLNTTSSNENSRISSSLNQTKKRLIINRLSSHANSKISFALQFATIFVSRSTTTFVAIRITNISMFISNVNKKITTSSNVSTRFSNN